MKISRILLVLVLASGFNCYAQDEPKHGALEITAEPGPARVYIEAFFAGEIPVKVEEIPPGIYRVVIRKETFDDFLQDIDVTPGETSKVEAEREEVSFCDSSGLGFLITAFKATRDRVGELKLLRLNQEVQDLWDLTKLSAALDIYTAEDEAVASCK